MKAFNTIGAEHLAEGGIEARSLDFDVADLGGPEATRIAEDHARLWIHLALRCGWGRSFGFTVARPDA